MLNFRKHGSTSVILRFPMLDSSNNPVGDIDNETANLSIQVSTDASVSATNYRTATNTIEDIDTIGTYQTPSTGKCRFKRVPNTSGLYELHLPDSWFSVTGATKVSVLANVPSTATGFCEVLLSAIPTHLMSVEETVQIALTTDALDAISEDVADHLFITSTGFDNFKGFFENNSLPSDATLDSLENLNTTGFSQVVKIGTSDSAKAIIEAATEGTLCLLSPGVHNLSSNRITIPNGVTVRGCGRDTTRITSSASSGTTPVITPGNRSVLEDLTVHATTTTEGTFVAPFGVSGSTSAQDFMVRNTRLIGRADAVYLISTAACSGRVEQTVCHSSYDGIVAGMAAHTLELDYVDILTSNANETGSSTGISATHGTTIRGSNVRVFVNNVGLTTDLRGVSGPSTGGGGHVLLHDSNIAVGGLPTNSKYSAFQSGSGSVTLIDCEFDRSLTQGRVTEITRKPPVISGEVEDSSPTATTFYASEDLVATNNAYNKMVLVFVTGSISNRGIPRKIQSYTSDRQITLSEPLPVAPSNGHRFVILGLID